MKVALYVRVSTDKQDAANQLADLNAYCARMGYADVSVYNDTASGAKGKKDRAEFNRLLEDARLRRFDLLLFWSLDRISREGCLETLQYLKTLTGYGVEWRSHQEAFLDSTGPFRDAVIGLLATCAKIERQRTIERTQASIRRRREQGLPLGRPKVIFDREKVRRLHEAGRSVRQIGKQMGLSVGTVHRALAG